MQSVMSHRGGELYTVQRNRVFFCVQLTVIKKCRILSYLEALCCTSGRDLTQNRCWSADFYRLSKRISLLHVEIYTTLVCRSLYRVNCRVLSQRVVSRFRSHCCISQRCVKLCFVGI